MATLYLVRHGETAWNRAGRWQGQHDEPLSDVGVAQADAIAARLGTKAFASLHASDLARAWSTALAIGAAIGLDPIADERLREVDVGEWRGLTPGETEQRHPHGFARWRAGGTGWRDGETYAAMRVRAVEVVEEILLAADPDARILVVTHGGVVRNFSKGPFPQVALVAECRSQNYCFPNWTFSKTVNVHFKTDQKFICAQPAGRE